MSYAVEFQMTHRTQATLLGGKAALLGELSRIDGISVPVGFCVMTDAFRRALAAAPSFRDRLDQLTRLAPDDREVIRGLSAEVRDAVRASAIPDEVAAAVVERVTRLEVGGLMTRGAVIAREYGLPAAVASNAPHSSFETSSGFVSTAATAMSSSCPDATNLCARASSAAGSAGGAKLRNCTLAAFELGDESPRRDRSNYPEHHRTEEP